MSCFTKGLPCGSGAMSPELQKNPTPKVPVLETPAMLLGSLIRSCMTAKTRNSYQVSYSRRDNTLSAKGPVTATTRHRPHHHRPCNDVSWNTAPKAVGPFLKFKKLLVCSMCQQPRASTLTMADLR